MPSPQLKKQIEQNLQAFSHAKLKSGALAFLATLGYESKKRIELEPNTPAEFMATFDLGDGRLNDKRALLDEWQAVEVLFQLTRDEISQHPQLSLFSTHRVDNTIIESYLFLAIELKGESYTRTQLATITREVNKHFPMPVLLLFRHGSCLTFSIINRRLHKRDAGKDVLEKVTLIKDINFRQPHRAHIEILHDLALGQLYEKFGFGNFVQLHQAWQQTLDSSELNKRFFEEVANWYFWAADNVTFPREAHPDREIRNKTSLIRLITRLIFVWFIKEKGLVPPELFNPRKLPELLNYADPNDSAYYKAILQNLFFATLNQEMNTPAKPDNRKFRHKAKAPGQRDPHYMIHNLYRYEAYFKAPAQALELFSTIPFLNGGLFECLDKEDPANPNHKLRIDGFSDRADNDLKAPDFLFFSEEREVDLNDIYGTANRRYKVRGLINILDRYKFTINENTPIEEEIALDPELLGKVFENLLAAYNPETETTARKQTGSFYTPREIVNYMVDESLIAYLQTHLQTSKVSETFEVSDVEARLRHLLAYNEEKPQFDEAEKGHLIEAIDNIKILDPAAGSGAFPMGILHKLVFILGKLDPHNERWQQKQFDKAAEIPDSTIRAKVLAEIEAAFEQNELDYGRKLYLIENCIYGVDIQPIAVQIAKLRFFISLVVDQKIDDSQPNRGVLPLPNLETKFVAANTLLGIDKPPQMAFKDPAIEQKEKELEEVRHRHFSARSPSTKEKYRQMDAKIRAELSQLLRQSGFRPEATEKLAAWNPYDQNTSANFFEPEWMYGITEGFDIVIGNPPYLNFKAYSSEEREVFREVYKEIFDGKADVLYYFIFLGVKLLKSKGFLNYIVSRYWLEAEFASKLRNYLAHNIRIAEIIDFQNAVVFEQGIKVCIFSAIKHKPAKADGFYHRAYLQKQFDSMEGGRFNQTQVSQQNLLNYEGRWVFYKLSGLQVLEKIKNEGELLGDIAYCKQGIVTGRDAAFVIQNKNELRGIPDFLIKRWVKVGDIFRYAIEPVKERFLVYTNDVEDINDYPVFKARLIKHKQKLDKRREVKNGRIRWFDLQWPREKTFFDNEKLICRFKAQRNTFALDENQYYSSADTTIVVVRNEFKSQFHNKYLLALLNSKLLDFYFKSYGKLMDYRYEYYPKPVSLLRIKKIPKPQQMELVNMADQVMSAKDNDATTDTSVLEWEIDQLVYRLYGLTDEEIAVVEESVGR